MRTPVTAAALALLAACAPVPTVCPSTEAVEGTVAGLPDDGAVLRDDLELSGTTSHPGGLAVRNVYVGGIAVTPDETAFNLSSWTITLSHAMLASLADDDDLLTLPVTAVDACGTVTALVDTRQFEVDTTVGVAVDDLQIDVHIPLGESFVPADGSAFAVLTVSAADGADDAQVHLSTSVGGFYDSSEGDVDPEANVRLAGADGEPATAEVLLAGAELAGTALIVAESEGEVDTVDLLVAAAPRLSPAAFTLQVDQQLTVDALQDLGRIDTCRATVSAAGAFTVTADGVDLGGGAAVTASADGGLAITVAATDTAAGQSVTVECCDAYRQCGTGTYAVDPEEEP
jgi:hypothetical protein